MQVEFLKKRTKTLHVGVPTIGSLRNVLRKVCEENLLTLGNELVEK